MNTGSDDSRKAAKSQIDANTTNDTTGWAHSVESDSRYGNHTVSKLAQQ